LNTTSIAQKPPQKRRLRGPMTEAQKDKIRATAILRAEKRRIQEERDQTPGHCLRCGITNDPNKEYCLDCQPIRDAIEILTTAHRRLITGEANKRHTAISIEDALDLLTNSGNKQVEAIWGRHTLMATFHKCDRCGEVIGIQIRAVRQKEK
jgi:hypothetical protein